MLSGAAQSSIHVSNVSFVSLITLHSKLTSNKSINKDNGILYSSNYEFSTPDTEKKECVCAHHNLPNQASLRMIHNF